jgi:hypothetical protein
MIQGVFMKEICVSGFVGLITGAIASLIAPWIQWVIEIEKRQRKIA